MRQQGFTDVSLKVRKGEIVGIAGLVGAGRTELARALFGLTKPKSGTVKLNGNELAIQSHQDAMGPGLALVREDRIHDGWLQPQSVAVNATLASLRQVSSLGFIRPSAVDTRADDATRKLNLKRQSINQPVSELSGGNQQKVVLAKWLMTEPKLLILDEPTRGVDVGAKHEVHKAIHSLAQQGLGVLMISSDLNEILALSHRVLVMRGGRIVAEISRGEATQESIMRHAACQEAHA